MSTELTWKLSADQNVWELRDGPHLVNTLHWDRERGGFGTYVDAHGCDLGREFDKARAAVEKMAVGGVAKCR